MTSIALPDAVPRSPSLPLALLGAAAMHALVLTTVGFDAVFERLRTPEALEVLLVQPSDSTAPDEADYLAAHAQDGGGSSERAERPGSPVSSELPHEADGIAPVPIRASTPVERHAVDEMRLTAIYSDYEISTEETPTENVADNVTPDRIAVEQDLEIARLSAEIERQQQQFAKRPKKKWLTARTQEASSAEYMYRWVEKVERIGNLNYPDSARRRSLTGALVLIVGIYKNGEIESVTVDESSGQRLLDDAAKRIVRLAGPFEPLTGKLAEETDILYIVRTWEFQSSNSVISY